MIEFRNLTLAYGDRRLLDGVSAVVPAGEVTALVGRNGTGKSTLLRAVAGTDSRTVTAGQILIDGRDASRLAPMQRARTVAVVTTDKCRVANLRVEDAVALGRSPYTNWIGRMQRDDRDTVRRSLETVGMESFAAKSMDSLSDGEAQRV
ncbi:MAG: ABC transporter ATP-binding protein, partial [Alistipes sp.]|nr:ABC transporter ATP-binding protein [Alistipes sp.]